MVCAKCTTSKVIFLAAPDGPLGDVGQMETHFGLFGDSVNQHARQVHGCAERAIGLEILFGKPKGTPR
jgi:hypothetical protein